MFIKRHAAERFRERCFNSIPGTKNTILSKSDVYCLINYFIDNIINKQAHFLCVYKGNDLSKTQKYNRNAYGIFFDKLNVVFVVSQNLQQLFTIRHDGNMFHKTKNVEKEKELRLIWEELKNDKVNAKTFTRISINKYYSGIWNSIQQIQKPDRPSIRIS